MTRSSGPRLIPLISMFFPGFGFREEEGKGMVQRVIKETPRLGQLIFQLSEPPRSQYNVNGQYPAWIGDIFYRRFNWNRVRDSWYEAHAIAEVTPGPALRDVTAQAPIPARATVELTVELTVQRSPPPFLFLPSASMLRPMFWTLYRVDGRSVEERGGFVDYRE